MTTYAGTEFPSKLAATWAAFFDLAGWDWCIASDDIRGWNPTFRLNFDCNHSECGGMHSVLASVEAWDSLDQFADHPCLAYPYGRSRDGEVVIGADASAALGSSPDVSQWEMSHGAGGGIFNIPFWVPNADALWAEAVAITS